MTLFSSSAIQSASHELARRDSVLSQIVSELGQIEARKQEPDFAVLCSIITNQQLSGKAAKTIFSRVKSLPELRSDLNAENFVHLNVDALRACGLSKAKADYLLGYARLLQDNPRYFEELRELPDDAAVQRLVKLRGIGPWTAAIFLMSAQGRMDLFPIGDGTLERSVKALYDVCAKQNKEEFERLVFLWSPYRSIAASYLWKWFDSGDTVAFQGSSNN